MTTIKPIGVNEIYIDIDKVLLPGDLLQSAGLECKAGIKNGEAFVVITAHYKLTSLAVADFEFTPFIVCGYGLSPIDTITRRDIYDCYTKTVARLQGVFNSIYADLFDENPIVFILLSYEDAVLDRINQAFSSLSPDV